MNLRVAIFEKKSLSLENTFSELTDVQNRNKWIVMGHFDLLTVHKLKCEYDFFKIIYEKNIELTSEDCNSYCYPLYLMTENNDDDFWSTQSTFSAIVKVHFSSSVRYDTNNKILKEELKRQEIFNNVEFETYNTLELSDVVVVFKSNYLSSILKCTAALRSLSFVGKIYTYPMISAKSLKDENLFKMDDKIEYMSLKFSLYSSSKISSITKLIKNTLNLKDAYSITGFDDILFCVPNASANDLYKFYSRIFINKTEQSAELSNLITRVGVAIKDSESDYDKIEIDESNKTLFNTCVLLLKQLDEINAYIIPGKHKWFISLYELIKLLSRMSKTPVLDEFVYLILPGLIAFINNLYIVCTDHIKLEEHAVEFNVFVQGLTDLIEQIIRSEGQLTHSPELRPVMYNLPVVMLEYIQAFLKLCSELLKKADLKNENIRLLLVPKIINRVEAIEIFASSDNNEGLIEIGIPFDMLYKPLQLQCNLCHEISHFIGEKHRNREQRLKYYSKAVSILISKVLFEDFSNRRISAIDKLLLEQLVKYDSIENKNMMCQMQENVEKWINSWFQDDKNYYQFVRELFKNMPDRTKEDSEDMPKTSGNVYKIHRNYLQLFSPLLNQISWLFKEIYADICMTYLLSINDPREYINQFASELENEEAVEEYSISGEKVYFGSLLYEIYTIRMYVTLKATGNALPKYSSNDPEYFINICKNMYKIDNDINNKKQEIDSYIPKGVVNQLLKYAQDCFLSLKTSTESDETYKYIKTNTLDKNAYFNYSDIFKFIEEYRKELLISFEDNLKC